MTDLNAPNDRMVLIIDCKVRDAIEALSAWGASFRSYHSGYNREIVGPR